MSNLIQKIDSADSSSFVVLFAIIALALWLIISALKIYHLCIKIRIDKHELSKLDNEKRRRGLDLPIMNQVRVKTEEI